MKFGYFFCLLFCIGVITESYSQDHQSIDNARIKNVIKVLSVPEARAIEIMAALDYNNAQIVNVLKDKKMSQLMRRDILATLYSEKWKKIESVLTSAQMAQLKIATEGNYAQAGRFLKENQEKHKENLSTNETIIIKEIKGGQND